MERLWLRLVIFTLGLGRWTIAHESHVYTLLSLPWLQPFLERVGRLRAREVFLKARDECPAYREFLDAHGVRDPRRWTDIAVTTKENYVRRYSVEQRCCRWLLTTQDRVGSQELNITHEFLAQMLGVRRASVTEVLRPLQSEGLIRASRGKVVILDPKRLADASCECYSVIRNEYQRLLG